MEELAENHLECLPDDLLRRSLDILRVLDAKSLIRCLAVSKHLASLVPVIPSFFFLSLWRQIDEGTIPWPPFPHPDDNLNGDVAIELIKSKRSYSIEEMFQYLKLFPEIRTLTIDLDAKEFYHDAEGPDNILKWKAELDSNSAMLNSCVILAATALQRRPQSYKHALIGGGLHEGDHPLVLPPYSDEIMSAYNMYVTCCLEAVQHILSIVRRMVPNHPMLREVVLKNFGQLAVIRAGQGEISKIRNSTPTSGSNSGGEYRLYTKVWFMPKLILAKSGYVMRGALLAVTTRVGDNGAMERTNYEDIVGFHFDGEEDPRDSDDGVASSLVVEAVREMRKTMNTAPCMTEVDLIIPQPL
ncbi:hypothetical protein CDL15_Pgr000097 [Punica granatum]|uniref:F-box domain-containing protein n=1 Tax=Punica granatum TaxID=22663 RepID=A0A218Y1R4_PUNGR|nr:hypothetical protein CDL15_Pgr000097 [Punica granatum]PKI61812.1 hypothetical protein CRG98_017789 [Punica granatum]